MDRWIYHVLPSPLTTVLSVLGCTCYILCGGRIWYSLGYLMINAKHGVPLRSNIKLEDDAF